MKKLSVQHAYIGAFVLSTLLVASAILLEIYQRIIPCPLCLIQRYIMGLLAILFLVGILLSGKKWGQIVTAIMTLPVSILGAVAAGRQVWLQHLPPNPAANCDVGLQYMLQALPLQEVVHHVFQGSSGCAEVAWQFLQLSLAEWSLMGFIAFAIFAVWQFFRSVMS